jgi:hypothetical protein
MNDWSGTHLSISDKQRAPNVVEIAKWLTELGSNVDEPNIHGEYAVFFHLDV